MSDAEHSDVSVEYDGIRYIRPPRPLRFPVSDEGGETKWHLEVRTLMYQYLLHGFSSRAHVGSQQFVYWNAADPQLWLAPDAFVRLGGPDDAFATWNVWERGAPHVAVEIESLVDWPPPPDEDARNRDWIARLEKYRSLGVRELLRFDPENDPRVLRIWDRIDNDLLERAGPDNVSKVLPGYWLVVNDQELGPTLRLSHDAEGKDLFLTPTETYRRVADTQARAADAHTRAADAHTRAADTHAWAADAHARIAKANADKAKANQEIAEAKASKARSQS
jgi:hypothetical protein